MRPELTLLVSVEDIITCDRRRLIEHGWITSPVRGLLLKGPVYLFLLQEEYLSPLQGFLLLLSEFINEQLLGGVGN